MRYIYLILLFFTGINFLLGQETINQNDSNGLKQGRWQGKYPGGNIRYEGSFLNGKPVGAWKRYHENGKLKAQLFHIPNTDKVEASLFDDEGILYAKGIFIGTLKDSIWTYFNDKTVVGTDSYVKGKKEGVSRTFYADGQIEKEVIYKNGFPDGPWREFYPNGAKRSEMLYQLGARNGWSIAYYENGQIQAEGNYLSDKPQGTWSYFTAEGILKFKLEYKDGILLNPEILDSIQLKEFSKFDQNRGKLKDPAQLRNNPDELMRP